MKDQTSRQNTGIRRRHHLEHHRGHRSHEADQAGQGSRFHHDAPTEEEHHGGPGGGHRGGHGGGHGGQLSGRSRARRGEARYVLLDALRDGPKHGYEIIKYLEERSAGKYAPSPGTVYPTMQFLEDLGQVQSSQSAERRVYALTEAGQAELEARAGDLNAFWTRFGTSATAAAGQPQIGFLREEIDSLARTIWNGLRGLDDTEKVRSVRAAVERCRSEVREIIADPAPLSLDGPGG